MFKLKFTNIYENDYYEIIKYLLQFYPDTPVKFKNKLKSVLSNIRTNPHMYKTCFFNPKFKQANFLDYVVFYKIVKETETEKMVEVHRILHGARDIENILK
ncbi:MAG: type II toxin-antitoxin system RelE/ParE family toxin [Oscillospiraceae bacterium]|nr:type II toxin-antitoxin system RelE/ParE family toxin [Oscillospiraceae bacterium]